MVNSHRNYSPAAFHFPHIRNSTIVIKSFHKIQSPITLTCLASTNSALTTNSFQYNKKTYFLTIWTIVSLLFPLTATNSYSLGGQYICNRPLRQWISSYNLCNILQLPRIKREYY